MRVMDAIPSKNGVKKSTFTKASTENENKNWVWVL
jgi:hypothetical protein